MNKTKIEWCDFTWNPVWGCRNNCPYCYARRLAHRFGESFEPHWKEKNFNRQMPKQPSRIFVNSMSDVAFWEDSWTTKVFDRIQHNPQHTFLFLTKRPACYQHLHFLAPENCWFGVTITNQAMMNYLADLIFETTWDEERTVFLSVEPILEPIKLYVRPDWLIIGAETGNRKGKIVPERDWIRRLVEYKTILPVFMKDSLISIWGEDLIRQWPR